jgi:hypothetical protein
VIDGHHQFSEIAKLFILIAAGRGILTSSLFAASGGCASPFTNSYAGGGLGDRDIIHCYSTNHTLKTFFCSNLAIVIAPSRNFPALMRRICKNPLPCNKRAGELFLENSSVVFAGLCDVSNETRFRREWGALQKVYFSTLGRTLEVFRLPVPPDFWRGGIVCRTKSAGANVPLRFHGQCRVTGSGN